ncbi:MAG TPA: hypothetical protein VNU68_09910 [Verrucomicrobiae bacterium]|jgi:hypothetical protein|nr:hypothetical protein [Verrucomicrobiae bacterium]
MNDPFRDLARAVAQFVVPRRVVPRLFCAADAKSGSRLRAAKAEGLAHSKNRPFSV